MFLKGLTAAAMLLGSLILTAELAAYDGYGGYGGYGYQPPYEPYSYRQLSRTGRYHGYWRDMGYGFQPDRGVYFAPFYGAPYGGTVIVPGGGGSYYHPPRGYPYRMRY